MDDDLERLLRAYRPVGPPAVLRDRITARAAAPRFDDSVRSWLLPLAAAVAAIVFYVLAANVRGNVMPVHSVDETERQSRLSELTLSLGGDATARSVAEHLLELEEQVVRIDATRNPAPDFGEFVRD